MKLILENWRKFLKESDGFRPHMMYDPASSDKKQAKVEDDHNELAAKGYVHVDPEAIRKVLRDEGGAAGLKAIVDQVESNEEEVKKALAGMKDVAEHEDGDYILDDDKQVQVDKLQEQDESDEPEELEEPPNVLDLRKPLDAGFCQYNPLINQYAQSGPDGLAEMLIFVIATIRASWYEVVPNFPSLMKLIRDNDGLPTRVGEKGLEFYALDNHSKIAFGDKKASMNSIWKGREKLFSQLRPYFNKINTSGENSIEKEDAVFQMYLEFLKIKGLGYPKAAFAAQLVTGRLGCLDSINLSLYKGLDPDGKLIKFNKKGEPGFRAVGRETLPGDIIQLKKGSIVMAERYVEFLREIAKLTKSTEAKISQQLWDSWVEIVARKINQGKDIDVIMPGGEKFTHKNKYAQSITKTSGGEFRRKYKPSSERPQGITGRDVSRQHDPRTMYESFDEWNKYMYSLIAENKEKSGKEIVTPEEKKQIKKIIDKLKKASKAHAGQATDLEDIIDEKKKRKAKTDYSKEKKSGLHGWFSRQGGKGKSSGWVDCNTCRKDPKTGRKKCKACGREEGEKRAKYPSCRPTPAACGTAGKGKKWGKKK